MASKCKDNNWKAAQSGNRASPVNYANWASICRCVTLDKVVNNQDNQVGHGDQGRDTGVLEGIQSAQIGKRYHDQPEDPKLV
jgi:hypothetical protein